jgi:hypothetical protein
MHDSRVPLSGDGAELARRANVPFAAQSQTISRESCLLRATDQGRPRRRHDESSITEVAKSTGEEKYLALAAAPAAPGVDVKNPGEFH